MSHKLGFLLIAAVAVIGCSGIALALFWKDSDKQSTEYRIGYRAGLLADKCAKDKQLTDIEQSLRIAYNLSMPEQEVYARVLRRLEERYGVSWALIAATVRVESNFTEGLRSRSHAKGLMQLMDSTAEYLASKAGIPYERGVTIWKFAENLYLGTQYLAEASTKDTSLSSIIKYYIAGPNWKQREGRADVLYYEGKVLREYEKLLYIYRGVGGN